jgi:hypothetical protein
LVRAARHRTGIDEGLTAVFRRFSMNCALTRLPLAPTFRALVFQLDFTKRFYG